MTTELPTPVKRDQRICFGIAYFLTEEEARIWGDHSRDSGNTYNGGYYHGRKCGRDSSWDHEKDGVKYYGATY